MLKHRQNYQNKLKYMLHVLSVASQQASLGNPGCACGNAILLPVQLGVSWCLEMLKTNEISHREDEMRVGGRRKDL